MDHPVTLPDLGNSNATPLALGASLLIVYKHPDPTWPLNAIVMYDGSWAMDNLTEGMTQTITGFYDPASVSGELTHIVGSGQFNKSENLRVNGAIVAVNPFDASPEGAAWDNVTVTTNPLPSGTTLLTTSVDHAGFSSFDCLTWSAVVYRTEVVDNDGDGLLRPWEENTGSLTDPNGVALPPLALMGADPDHKDLFVEIGYMNTNQTTSNGGAAGVLYGGVLKPHHTHLPSAAALLKVGAAFAAAPVPNPDLTPGINVHFDVGNNYQSGEAGPYVIPSAWAWARGGEAYDEMITVCTRGAGDPPWVCQFGGDPSATPPALPEQFAYPGTVGWKSAFRTLRDALIDDPAPSVPPEGDHICDTPDPLNEPDGICKRVFDRNRKHIFRYLFFPHFLGVPKAHCLVVDPLDPNFGLPDLNCQATNLLFHVPNTYTGVADFGGGDGMVNMGGFPNALGEPVGTDNQQAGTIMHELGHMLMLRHGGASGNPNCGPNYLSVMNYLFQLRLLIDGFGVHQVNYSGQTVGVLNESLLSELAGLSGLIDAAGPPPYRTAWYAPYAGVGTAATRHCNGSDITVGESAIRVDGTDVGGAIDWNADGDTFDNPPPQDINFDGVKGPLLGFNDWANLRLNQVGSRRNIGVWFLANDFPYIGPASLDMGRVDFGRLDFGRVDFGRLDFGRVDFGRLDFGDLNQGDLGRIDFGRVDFGRVDFGRLDFGVGAGDLGRGADGKGRVDFGRVDFGGGGDGEITITLAVAAGLLGPPTNLFACVAGHPGDPPCVNPPPGGLRVLLTWAAPDGGPSAYVVYRRLAGGAFAVVGTVEPVGGVLATTFVDSTVAYDRTYQYYVAARYVADGVVSESASNTATVTIEPQFYILLPVKNLPPRRQNSGSTVPIEWRFSLDGITAVDSSDAAPVLTLKSVSTGIEFSFNAEDPGASGFKLPTALNGWTWQFNIQLVYPAWSPLAGQNLPAATDYQIIITSRRMKQPFVSGMFGVR
jgi:hypothetical protein